MNGELNSLDERYSKNILIKLLDEKEAVPISKLHKYSKNYYAFKNVIKKLEEDGLVKTEEEVMGRKTIYVSLTEKGKAVAEKLKEAEEISRADKKYLELSKRMKIFIHLNNYEDHFSIIEIQGGKKRIANIYPKRNGKYLYLWCDIDEGNNCDHIYYALHDAEMRDAILRFAEKEGLKLAPIYEEDGG